MEVIEVESKTFSEIFKKPYIIYSSGEFALMNQTKVDQVFYLVFKDNKYRFGLIGGISNQIFYSPFSAPFGSFIFLKDDIKISTLELATKHLIDWAKEKNFISIHLTLPPTFYNETFISKQINSLFTNKFAVSEIALNHAYYMSDFDKNYPIKIWPNARKNLQIALKNNLSFFKCLDLSKKQLAYNVIKINRESKGYPLRMSWKQIEKTINLIEADFFLVKTEEGVLICSAIIFHINADIVQVIYWGDLPKYAHFKPMNFLSYCIFNHYKTQGIKIIDIGPSTVNSLPNYGLCEFKESIGCKISTKINFKYELF